MAPASGELLHPCFEGERNALATPPGKRSSVCRSKRILCLLVGVALLAGADIVHGLIASSFEPVAITVGLGRVGGGPRFIARVEGSLRWGSYLHSASADTATCGVSNAAGKHFALIQLESAATVAPGKTSLHATATAKIEEVNHARELGRVVLSGAHTSISLKCSLQLHLRVFSLVPMPIQVDVPASNISVGGQCEAATAGTANASLVSGWAIGRDAENGRLTASHGVFPQHLHLSSLQLSTDGASVVDATLRLQLACLKHLVRDALPSLRTFALAPSLLNRSYTTTILSNVVSAASGSAASHASSSAASASSSATSSAASAAASSAAASARRPSGQLFRAKIRIQPASPAALLPATAAEAGATEATAAQDTPFTPPTAVAAAADAAKDNNRDDASSGDAVFNLLADDGPALHISVKCAADTSGETRCLPNWRAFGEHAGGADASAADSSAGASVPPTAGHQAANAASLLGRRLAGAASSRYLSFGFAHNLTWVVEDEYVAEGVEPQTPPFSWPLLLP